MCASEWLKPQKCLALYIQSWISPWININRKCKDRVWFTHELSKINQANNKAFVFFLLFSYNFLVDSYLFRHTHRIIVASSRTHLILHGWWQVCFRQHTRALHCWSQPSSVTPISTSVNSTVLYTSCPFDINTCTGFISEKVVPWYALKEKVVSWYSMKSHLHKLAGSGVIAPFFHKKCPQLHR